VRRSICLQTVRSPQLSKETQPRPGGDLFEIEPRHVEDGQGSGLMTVEAGSWFRHSPRKLWADSVTAVYSRSGDCKKGPGLLGIFVFFRRGGQTGENLVEERFRCLRRALFGVVCSPPTNVPL